MQVWKTHFELMDKGKYIPSLADYILEKGGLNLKGIAVG